MCHVISIGYLKKVNTKRAQYRTIIIWLISLFSFKNYLFCEQIASCEHYSRLKYSENYTKSSDNMHGPRISPQLNHSVFIANSKI